MYYITNDPSTLCALTPLQHLLPVAQPCLSQNFRTATFKINDGPHVVVCRPSVMMLALLKMAQRLTSVPKVAYLCWWVGGEPGNPVWCPPSLWRGTCGGWKYSNLLTIMPWIWSWSCSLALTPVNKRMYVNFFSHFSHPPLTTALSSHVVVVVTHDDTNHHTTRWNSDCWHHWSLKWVHFATNHEERHSNQGGWTYRNWWYNVRKTQTRFFLVFEILCGDCQVFQLQAVCYI